MGAFDQDINAKVSLANPQLYERGIKGLEYSRTVFWTYMLDGLYQSAVVFFFPFLVYRSKTAATGHGYSMDAAVELGTTTAAAAVVCVTLFVALNTSYHSALMIGVLVLSALLLYVSQLAARARLDNADACIQIWVAIYSAFPYQFSYLVVILFGSFDFWALIVIIQVVAIGPHFLFKYIQSNYWPIDNNIIREAAVVKKLDRSVDNGEDGLSGGYSEKKPRSRGQTPAPQLNVPISESPMMNRRTPSSVPPTIDESQVEMAEFSRDRGPTPISAIPIHSPSKQSRHRIHQEQYDEVGEEALASPTTTTFPPRDYLSARERQHSGTPLSPGLYTSPPISPRSGKYGSDGDSPNMRREGSMASFATAVSEPYSDGEGEQYQYAGYAR